VLLITKIEKKEVPGNRCTIHHCKSAECEKEVVIGQEFVDHRTGIVKVIGVTREVKQVLSVPFRAFHDMNERIVHLLKENRFLDETMKGLELKLNQAYVECDAFRRMPWYRRLIFLFTGKRYL
jgi:hypothetical protein